MLRTVRVIAENGPVRVDLARNDGRLVVVKRLVGFHPVLERRLAREAEVVQKLRHPGILPLLSVRDGMLIYPYIPGINLAEDFRRGALPWRRARRVGVEALRALAYAHDRGIIHHDVKPGNLLQRGERTLLMDFGFAKDLGLSAITAISSALGTPNYMAPEQFRGVRDDPRSDLYAVGAVLYHAVVGSPPYGRDVLRMLAGEPAELAPIPASARPLGDWIRTALAPAPAGRYQSAREMLAATPEARAEVVR